MRILLTGANGYIGRRLLPSLVEAGHQVICCVRDRDRIDLKSGLQEHVEFYEVDFLMEVSLADAPVDFEVAYFLIHAMSGKGDFESREEQIARNFVKYLDHTDCQQLIYLGGIANEDKLSRHLRSRLNTEDILKEARASYSVLRAGIIVGSGSASFEIIRDLVEKLPVMVAPKWLNTKCQPIAIRNVVQYLQGIAGNRAAYNKVFDIGGPNVLTYKEMLLKFAKVRGFKRSILTVPVMTPRLSSYWLYFVTSTSYSLAVNLVNSMKVDVLVQHKGINDILDVELLSYEESVRSAFNKIEQNIVVSSWKDSLVSSSRLKKLSDFVEVPQNGVFKDVQKRVIPGRVDKVIDNIFAIGGKRGWYYCSALWEIRGLLDKMVGGVGLRRGRTSPTDLSAGDALDFWRVLVADPEEGRLLLYAEMKLPGEAWLEWRIKKINGEPVLIQQATFRPSGLLGRLYWYAVLPFHFLIFNGLVRKLVSHKAQVA